VHEIVYYEYRQNNPVMEFILQRSPKEQAKILREIDLLEEFGFTLGLPYVKKVVNTGLWELRIRHGSNIYRMFYVEICNKFLLLHGFQKKTDKTPKKEINVALKRLEEYLLRG